MKLIDHLLGCFRKIISHIFFFNFLLLTDKTKIYENGSIVVYEFQLRFLFYNINLFLIIYFI